MSRYKKDYPASLSKRLDVAEKDNRALKRERRELKERLTELNQQCIKYQGEGVTLRKKLAAAQNIIETLKRECSQLGHDLNRAC
ncbi:DivIVA domain-containing protein, partial [Escherichia coli]|nr:DivIVA domain-containing protein [Escherichia coli]